MGNKRTLDGQGASNGSGSMSDHGPKPEALRTHPGSTDETRDQTGRWKPGVSPNPSGRPKTDLKIRDLARQHTEAALNTLVECLASPNDSVRVSAAQALLDRGYGKAPASLEITHTNPIAPQLLSTAGAWLADPVMSEHVLALADAGAVVEGDA
jgi:hypothetical protein